MCSKDKRSQLVQAKDILIMTTEKQVTQQSNFSANSTFVGGWAAYKLPEAFSLDRIFTVFEHNSVWRHSEKHQSHLNQFARCQRSTSAAVKSTNPIFHANSNTLNTNRNAKNRKKNATTCQTILNQKTFKTHKNRQNKNNNNTEFESVRVVQGFEIRLQVQCLVCSVSQILSDYSVSI